MTKRMLIDDTQQEETRVVIIDGNKVEDVEFESAFRKQIKGNIYTAKVIRVEPSLQAAFIDYGGNKHGFLAFGEIHPDYYNLRPELAAAIDREVDETIERKKQYLKEREEQRERIRAEKQAQYEARRREEEQRHESASSEETEKEAKISHQKGNSPQCEDNASPAEVTQGPDENTLIEPTVRTADSDMSKTSQSEANEAPEKDKDENVGTRKARNRKQNSRRRKTKENTDNPQKGEDQNISLGEESLSHQQTAESFKVSTARALNNEPSISEEAAHNDEDDDSEDFESAADIDDDDLENDFELQRNLIRVRKLYHSCNIQDVIKEGQVLLIQVVKEERGNKGAACTTYLSLAGRYCVLMPNRIKSGGVSRKITNAADRKRLKEIIKELPLTQNMSMIVRTAGEDKTKADIVRDYNYLIRTWNHIRLNALRNKVPSLIYEEGDLIKRALRDMYTKDISEVIVDGERAYNTARDFVKILSPQNLKKIKCRKPHEMPLFQRFQVESQLDKLHNPVVQLESGGYLVINPTEALVSIDVNSGRATKEKDIEETALKTNLEAADEIAKQLRMRNLAGLVVIDFIDMDEPKNNAAVEKRMKEALKNDRARIQIAKMSCFGLLEISRQRMHSSFMESNYQPCPFCHGQGMVRTTESGAMLILRAIEEEGTKNRSSKVTVFVPTETAIYLLNQKRKNLNQLEEKYNISIVVSADNQIQNISDYRLERTKPTKTEHDAPNTFATAYSSMEEEESVSSNEARLAKDIKDTHDEEANLPVEGKRHAETMANVDQTGNGENGNNERQNNRFRGRRSRYDRRRNNNSRRENNNEPTKKETPVILYSSHQDINITKPESAKEDKKESKTAWWRKLIG